MGGDARWHITIDLLYFLGLFEVFHAPTILMVTIEF